MAGSSSGALQLSQEAQTTVQVSTKFPGFRFSPTDVELINYYLKKKMEGDEEAVAIISHVEICNFEPWDLPVKSIVQSDNEWFFFSSRGRKYPSGTQSKRATELGYWKATGKERNVKSGGSVIGNKRTLVFHLGRAPKGERTEWIIHEYNVPEKSQDSLVVCRLRKNPDFRAIDISGRESLPQQLPASPLVRATEAAGSVSGGDNELCGSDGDKTSKTHDSSHDSHSIDVLDSTSGSEPKRQSTEINLTESSSHQEGRPDLEGGGGGGGGDEDDFFADILNDDIINLGEPTFSSTLIPNFLQPDQSPSLRQQEKDDVHKAHPLRIVPSPAGKNKSQEEDPKSPRPYACIFSKLFWKIIKCFKK